MHRDNSRRDDRGVALIIVIVILAIFSIVIAALLFQAYTDRLVAVNEQDHIKTLTYADAGLTWAERRVMDSGSFSDLLDGPNSSSSADDHLLGIRDLSLTATNQFTTANQGTKSAVVTRDFGDGSKAWEVIQVPSTNNTRAHIYIRIDDTWDDDATDPSNNDPLSDTDSRIVATAIAEYPIFVNGNGTPQPNASADRGRSLRRVSSVLAGTASTPAVASDGDIDIPGNLKLCGGCGSLHSNRNLSIGGGPEVCHDATATGSFSNGGTIHGKKGGGYPRIPIPILSPYDDLFVPDPAIFTHLGCGAPSSTDPGNSKYFALILNNDKGVIYKAYYDFTNLRWMWKELDDLGDSSNVRLDNCGRAPGDPFYSNGNRVNDGLNDAFYGWTGESESTENCSSCGSSNGDKSLCATANNDFVRNGYYEYPSGTFRSSISGSNVRALPGDGSPDNVKDFDERKWLKSKWDYSSSSIYSPLYGAVIWIYGQGMISGNPGDSSSVDYCNSSGCSSTLPDKIWPVSFIATSDLSISGQANLGPANPGADYAFQMISARDIMLNGNPQEDTAACNSSACSTSSHTDITLMGGIYAAHEQIQISGNPNIFGFMIAEHAVNCSGVISSNTAFNGDPNIYYDCNHPPNPWNTASVDVVSWAEE